MRLVEQHIINKNDSRYKNIDHVCFLSKNLYNAALYVIKQNFLATGKWIRCAELNKRFISENNVDFRALSGSSAQQVFMALDNNLKSYFKAIKAWKRDNKKFTGCPKFPTYKHKMEIVGHHDMYVGKRVKRGLFRSKDGILLNADINGAYNIIRKAKGDSAMPPYTGLGYNPVIINV